MTFVDGQWMCAPSGYQAVEYGSIFPPLAKGILPAPWIIIDQSICADGLVMVRIHYDGDMTDQLKSADEWRLWPNKKKLSEWHNEPFRRMTRLKERRKAAISQADVDRVENHNLALDALELQAAIEKEPYTDHATASGVLSWSPTTQVWLRGRRWVKIKHEAA